MEVFGKIKLLEQLGKHGGEREIMQFLEIPSINELVEIEFCNSKTDNNKKIETYKITKRVLLHPIYKGRYFDVSKPHFICVLNHIEQPFTYDELYIEGYINHSNDREKTELAKKHTYTMTGRSTIPEKYTFATIPVLTDIVEIYAGYFLIQSITHKEKEIEINIGSHQEINIPIFN
jgi:hypothetical protein